MYEIYDLLIKEIPSALTVTRIIIGEKWTAVENSEGNLGMAMTTELSTIPESVDFRETLSLCKLAECVKSWNFLEASVGMAAINSYYNSVERMERLQSRQGNSKFCTFDLELKDKKVAMVGHLRHSGETFEGVRSLFILERDPKEGDYPDSACEYILPESDIVLITGSAFINKTMPRLLELSKRAITVLAGPSVPMAPQLLESGIERLAGFIPTNRMLIDQIEAGTICSPYEYGERFYLERKHIYRQNG